MKVANDLAIDRFPEPAEQNKTLASWYAPGLSDELGDRLLMFDNSRAPSLELLRFRRALTGDPGFEVALRRRVERLSNFQHPSFAMVRAVEHLGHGDGLALLSNYTPGKRLSEVIQDARGPAFATALIQQLAPALASLRKHDEGTGHGALAPSRIVVTPEGRLMIVEHVLGPALERLKLNPTRLRTEFGIDVPPGSTPYVRLDIRTDYYQLGLIALSLLLGRRLSPAEPLENVGNLLRQVARTADRESPVLFRRLRVWLESALQLNGQMFESPTEAQDAVEELAGTGQTHSTLYSQPMRALTAPGAASKASSSPVDPGRTASADDVGREDPATVSVRDQLSVSVSPTQLANAAPPIEARLDLRPTEDNVALPSQLDAPILDVGLQAPVQEQIEREAVPSVARRSTDRPQAPSEPPVAAQEEHDVWLGTSQFIEIHSRKLPWDVAALDDYAVLRGQEISGVPSVDLRSPTSPFPTSSLSGPVSASKRWTDRPRAIRLKLQTSARRGVVQSVVAGLALCVMGEGFVIATLVKRRAASTPTAILVETLVPGADVLVDGRSAGITPLQLNMGTNMRSIRVVDSRPPETNAAVAPPETRPAAAPKPERKAAVVAPAPQRTGGIRLLSPIEVEVFEGDKRLGSSTTGIVSAPVGRHELELVNSHLGYRFRQVVDVKGGHVVSVEVSPPNGRLSINAVPWAEVWVDGKSVGETPLGNLSVPLGEHEIIFRHPELGEQRRTVLVRLDVVTRVSANLQR